MVMIEKYQQYELVFRHFDENGDGKISPSELQRCGGAIPGFGAERQLSLEEAEAVVMLMDSDGDGLLCLEDFVRLVDGGGEEEKAKDLKEAFKLYAGDERGHCITPKSLKRMLSNIGESKSMEDCKRMISRFDINGDGVLQFDEFMLRSIRNSCWFCSSYYVTPLLGFAKYSLFKQIQTPSSGNVPPAGAGVVFLDPTTHTRTENRCQVRNDPHVWFAAALTRGLQELSQTVNCSPSGNSSTNLANFSTISPALGLKDGSSSTQALARLATVTAASNE
ncbi:hypothetical protein RJ639_033069 [Escallonia herrerae]|uniref:EF-hand domain-containing protein n=1 Tax=Escallonia herrerae TaxID=1293975 RepID=A0AA89B9J1_9ASTE|nr:hypothetical protein RJ639_033069 [Escallonia herrerae]